MFKYKWYLRIDATKWSDIDKYIVHPKNSMHIKKQNNYTVYSYLFGNYCKLNCNTHC